MFKKSKYIWRLSYRTYFKTSKIKPEHNYEQSLHVLFKNSRQARSRNPSRSRSRSQSPTTSFQKRQSRNKSPITHIKRKSLPIDPSNVHKKQKMSISETSVNEIDQWLQLNDLRKYSQTLMENGLKELDCIKQLNENDAAILADECDMGIVYKKKFINACKQYKKYNKDDKYVKKDDLFGNKDDKYNNDDQFNEHNNKHDKYDKTSNEIGQWRIK